MAAGRIIKPIQDAGWSWVIAVACCWVTFVIQGLVRSSGVIYVALIDTFEVTRGQASWPFTLRIAVWNLSGPLAGALSYRWSIRAITFSGILIVTVGYVVCFVASDITIVTIFLGVVQGFGVGISVTLIPVIINQYFSKYKTTGAGIACAGATAGSFALSPLVELTIEEYGLSGAFLMMGGMTLHGVLGAALMRPAEWLKNDPKTLPEKSSKIKEYNDTSQRNIQPSPESKPFLKEEAVSLTLFSSQENVQRQNNDFGKKTLQENPEKDEEVLAIRYSANGSLKNNSTSKNSSPQNGYVYSYQDEVESGKEDMISETCTLISESEGLGSLKPIVIKAATKPKRISQTYLNSNDIPNVLDSLCHQDDEDVIIKGGKLQFTNKESNYNPQINITPLEKQNNSDNIDLLEEKHCNHDSSNSSDIRHRCGRYANPSSIISRNDSVILEKCPSKWRTKLGGFLEPMKAASSVLTNPVFLLIAFNYSVFFLSYMTYLIVIVDYALDLGISKTDSVFLVSTFSIADLCGRLGSGWVTDNGFIKRKNLLMTNMTIVGTLLISTSFSENYVTLMAVSVTMGLVVGVNLIIFYALVEEYLGLQKMAMAVGLMNFSIGCLSLVTPFLTGLFRDTLGTYIYLFHFLGVTSIFCGLLWALESILTSCRGSSMTATQDFPQDLD